MLSKKMAVSLTSLITIFAMAFAVPSAMAFTATITGDTKAYYLVDDDGNPVIDQDPTTTAVVEAYIEVPLTITLDQPVDETVLVQQIVGSATDLPATFVDNTIYVYAQDKDGAPIYTVYDTSTPTFRGGFVVDAADPPVLVPASAAATTDLGDNPKELKLTLRIIPQEVSGSPLSLVSTASKVAKVTVALGPLTTTNPLARDTGGALLKSDAVTSSIEVMSSLGTVDPMGETEPKVVSIQRLLPGSQTSVVAAFLDERVDPDVFDVRVVLTQWPHGIGIDTSTQKARDDSAKNLIKIEHGVVSNLRVGTPFEWFGGYDKGVARPQNNGNRPYTIRPYPQEGQYIHNGVGPLAGTRPGDTRSGNAAYVPLPTGTLYNHNEGTRSQER